MIYDKDSMYYQLNKAELEDMERHVPMTIQERTAIRFWVRRGTRSNPIPGTTGILPGSS